MVSEDNINKRSNPPADSPLGRKQLFFILLFSSIVTLLGTSVQLTIEYRNDIGDIHEQLKQIEKGYLQSLTHSLWKLDDAQIEIELKNMLSLRDVVALEIIDAEELFYHRAGEVPPDQNVIHRNYEMIYKHNDTLEKIGTLKATASLVGTYHRLGKRILMVLITQGIKTFLVSFFILFVIHFMVTRHLGIMARYVRSIVPGSSVGAQLTLVRRTHRKDELDEVVQAINNMENRLHDDIEKRNDALAELEKSEKEVKRNQELLKTVLSSLDEVVLLIDPPEQLVVDCNNTIHHIFGYDPEEIIGKQLTLLHTDGQSFQKFNREASQSVLEKGFFSTEWVMKHKDGGTFPTELFQTMIRKNEDAPELAVLIIRDISQRKELESQLFQSHKMEAIGTLAGGIAHDFNNILTIIMGNAELAVQSLPADATGRREVVEIYNASLRAKEVIAQLLKFSRKMEITHIPIDPRLIVLEVENLIRSSMPPNITMEQQVGKDIWTIRADPTQIHQIILNLCTNAVQSMVSREGHLVITLTNVLLDDESDETIQGLAPGKYVLLEVSDTGEGIAKENLSKIFDPYFTTKAIDKGTGMGLSVVQGIVSSHRGAIAVESRPDEGTTFRVYLPAQEEIPQGTAQRGAKAVHTISPTAVKVLLVDDEPQVLNLGKVMIERLGHTVEVSRLPLEALSLIQAAPHRIDLLITDLSMPAMTGIELARAVHEIRRDLPIILSSGYTLQIDQAEIEAAGILRVLEKPFNTTALSKAMGDAVGVEKRSSKAIQDHIPEMHD